ncbi:MAG: Thymidylate synthase [Methanosaeta sp. PtaB.Bin039]|nr:MAG: Thymidylate synthase [Methanosaeta sp. PtaB.Bin039]OPY45265.1 MAG: Thymidylate synthase [Methanosaeta sp. PtaU1.Bin028]HOT07625.1 DUF166 domain-containing protein [Methanotrichaceae archaeon]HQF15673.1 DUF166 domain-containing protein [Methanotrichaceae archaeon]HQI90409.1 DUF166 domain-containing protein [Methanotrichaceae archaeon]
MRVGVITRGKYGERLIETVRDHTDFEVVSAAVPEYMPGFIEDPEEFLREVSLDPSVFESDLMIMYTLHPDITPALIRMAAERGVKAVLVPGGMGRAGSVGELQEISRKFGTYIEVDEICCTLEPCGVPEVDLFASRLGKPELKVRTSGGLIEDIEVIRGSPCGATWHAASALVKKTVAEAPSQTGLFCQQYPCRAVRGTPGGIHTSGDLHKDAMERALGLPTQLCIPAQSRPIKIRNGAVEA